MGSTTTRLSYRDDIAAVMTAALRAVDPEAAVHAQVTLTGKQLRIGSQTYNLSAIDRIFVIGGGKAGAPMAAALAAILGERITAGVINVKYGHTARSTGWQILIGSSAPPAHVPAEAPAATGAVIVLEAGHPVPDQAGQSGVARMLALLRSASLTPRDLVIVLISGGGSALLPLPAPGVTLADLQALTGLLLRCGASIAEINTIRKHCSQLQGGQLARLAAPARVAALILSDVVGTPLDVIASGPTVPDPTSFADALGILERYGILDQVPPGIRARLAHGLSGSVPETPKPGDRVFEQVNNVVIGDNAIAGRAAVAEARRVGWHASLLTTFLQGEAREVGRVAAALAQGFAGETGDLLRPACFVLGGETTVTIRGSGRGGRNQELALAAAIALDEYRAFGENKEAAVATLATDGNDGPTDAAGGLATPLTIASGRSLGLDADQALAANDSYTYLAAVEGLVVTGPTNTNVNDLLFIFCR